MITLEDYVAVRDRLVVLGYADDYSWAQTVRPPATAEALVCEYAWVVLNSGMRNTVATKLMDRVWPRLVASLPLIDVFKHRGKVAAIEGVWNRRAEHFDKWQRVLARQDVEDVLRWCWSLPWIGRVTKYHLAKNLGADVAKPDRWLVRLAQASGETVDELCSRLAAASGDRIATVDVVLWRACAVSAIEVTETGIGRRWSAP